MAAFTEKDIRVFAAKAKLQIESADETAFAKDLNETYKFLSIIHEEYEELEEIPSEDRAPASQPSTKRQSDSLPREDILNLAPDTEGVFIRVPRVLPSKGRE